LAETSRALDRAPQQPAPTVAQLFEKHADGIFNFCRRLTGDPTAAEDLTQEVFVRALRYGSSFEGRASASTWLYAIASNLCKDHFGQRKRLHLVEDETLQLLAGSHEPGADRDAEQDQTAERIRLALGRLTEGQREVLVLSRYHGKTYAEISEITGQSVTAIKQTVFRAVGRLRTLLQEGPPPGGSP
jgi:RNA polymerase sigma-70 factor, ECF subfamily